MFLPDAWYDACDELGVMIYHDMQVEHTAYRTLMLPPPLCCSTLSRATPLRRLMHKTRSSAT
jgi:beta-galactosidase/beta-glucuronidase